jgi:hypothetical protein
MRIDRPQAIGEYATSPLDRPGNRESSMTNCRWPTITLKESIDDVGKSGELGYGKILDGPENAVRQKRESSIRGTDIAQQHMLMRAIHQ